ncbi:MAG: MazG family protein [Rhabdochlamydiaceae bacterium]|nr:MazG family protein [Rhabdochlamydiaceae bacterium]
MKEFDALLEVAQKLIGPGGCPWDQEQTFSSLQPFVLEECHEVIEAVDHNEDHKIVEELGDLLYTIVFYGKLGEKQGRFSMEEIVKSIREKLIRRHPHVFSDLKINGVEDVLDNWEKIKKQEKPHEKRESALDGIPPTLPTLIKAQKVVKKLVRAEFPELAKQERETLNEAQAAEMLMSLILQSEASGIDLESALRRVLQGYEKRFREWESQ